LRKKAIPVIKQPKNVPLAEAYMHIDTSIRHFPLSMVLSKFYILENRITVISGLLPDLSIKMAPKTVNGTCHSF